MKLLRLLLLAVAGVIGLIGVLALLFALPAVQKGVAKRALNRRPDVKVEIGRIVVGIDRIDVENLRFDWRGKILTVPSAIIDVPVFSALRKRVLIQRIVAKGWTLDLTAASQAPPVESVALAESAQAPAAIFAGFFQLLQLPVELSIADANLEGSIVSLKSVGALPDRTAITLLGGHFGVGQEGEFTVIAKTTLSDQTGGPAEIETKAVVATRLATARSFDHLRVAGTATGKGGRLPQHEKLDFACDLAADASGEKYLFALRSLAGTEPKSLIDLNGTYLSNSDQVKGAWKCDLRDTDLASFTFGHRLPAFIAQGEGRYEADHSLSEIHASGRLETTVEKLENLKPSLSVMGKVRALSDFDLVQQGTHVQVERLRVELSTDKPVALLKASQRFEFDLQTAELKVAEPTASLLELTLEGFPLAWLAPVLGDFVLAGDDARGTFVVSAREGGFALRPTGPMVIHRFTLSKAGRPLSYPLDLLLSAGADLSPQGWQTHVSDFELRDREVTILAGTLKFGQVAGPDQPVKAAGEFRGNLSALASQPLCAGFEVLNRGRGKGIFTASLIAGTTSVAAKLQLDDLAAEAGALPKVTADIRADLHAEGHIEAQIPLVFEKDGRVSDLQLNAKLRMEGSTCLIDADLAGGSVFVDDLKLIAALVEGRTKSKSSGTKPARMPFWTGISGPVKTTVKEVTYSTDLKIRNLTGTAKFDATTLVFEGWRGHLGQSNEATASGALSFNATALLPYEFIGNFTMANLDPVPALTAIEPGKLPTVDGKFEISGKVSSSAYATSELSEHPRTELKLSCRGGKFRGFDLRAGALNLGKTPQGITSKLAGIVALGASVIGRGSATPAERAKAITEATRFLAEINFDQLSLDLLVLPSEPIAVRDFSLITPEVRINGTGSFGHAVGNSWAQRPLALDLQVSVRGVQADNLRVLGLLKPEADSLGYLPLIEKLSLDGTIANVGANSLLQLIQQKPAP